jgi:CRP-like cAMP-binding protein
MVDADILRQWVVNLGRRSAKCRIAHLVCEMAMRLGAEVRTAGACFPLAMTQSQLADVTGLTTVHVNRVLKGFKQDGIAEVGRGEVIIHDWAALKATGDFNADYLQTDVRPDERMRILHAN